MAAGAGHHPWSQRFDKRHHEKSHNSAQTQFETLARAALSQRGMHFSTLALDDSKPGDRSATLEGLKVITFPELELDEVHYGRVLYGRLSAKAFKMAAVQTVLEDEFGRAVRLSVYDAVSSMASPEEIEALFPVGMKVAIKEPYFKSALDGGTAIRVDNPTDVIRISDQKDNDPEPESQEAKKAEFLQAIRCKGNKLFSKEDWSGAISQYSLCIDGAADKGESLEGMSKNLKDVIKLAYSNRAEALLRSKQFMGALSDAEKALELDPAHVKSLSRQGRAAMEVGLYEKACEAFVAVLERCPEEPSASGNLKLCREKLVQTRTGN